MITSGFFNSIDGDRRYRAEDFANYFNSIVSTGVFEDTIGNLSVSPSSGMSVAVAPGKAFINGYCMISSSAVSMTIPAAHASLDRIDRIVVRLDLAGRAMNIVLLSGTPSGTATPPELTRSSSRYDLCLAQISVPAGTTAITSALITDTRSDANLCGGVYVRTADQLVLDGKADKAELATLTTKAEFNPVKATVEGVVANSYYVCPHNRQQTFTASGNWTCPDGVTSVDVWLVGGGGGGVNYVDGNAGGGGGCAKLFKNIAVTPGSNNSIIVGAGGNGAYSTFLPSSRDSNTTTANTGGYSRFKTSGIQAGGGIGCSVTITTVSTGYGDTYRYDIVAGAGGSGGGGIVCGNTLAPGKNGSNAQTLSVPVDGLSVSIGGGGGGGGQGDATTNPYSGIRYSDGGAIAAAIPNSGNGGQYNGSTAVENAGSSGIVIIYWTEED